MDIQNGILVNSSSVRVLSMLCTAPTEQFISTVTFDNFAITDEFLLSQT